MEEKETISRASTWGSTTSTWHLVGKVRSNASRTTTTESGKSWSAQGRQVGRIVLEASGGYQRQLLAALPWSRLAGCSGQPAAGARLCQSAGTPREN